MATLVEGPKLGHTAVQASSPIAHPSSGAAQDHTRTWKLLRATLGYNIGLLQRQQDEKGCRQQHHMGDEEWPPQWHRPVVSSRCWDGVFRLQWCRSWFAAVSTLSPATDAQQERTIVWQEDATGIADAALRHGNSPFLKRFPALALPGVALADPSITCKSQVDVAESLIGLTFCSESQWL